MNLNENETYIMAMVTSLMIELKKKGLLTEVEEDNIIEGARYILYTKTSEKHKGFGV